MKRSRTPPSVSTSAGESATADGKTAEELEQQLAALVAKRAAIKSGEHESFRAKASEVEAVRDAEIKQSETFAAERTSSVQKLCDFETQAARQSCDSQKLKFKKELLAQVDEEKKRVQQLLSSGRDPEDVASRVTTRKLRSKKVVESDGEGESKKQRKTKDGGTCVRANMLWCGGSGRGARRAI